jgi:hypothetical protein
MAHKMTIERLSPLAQTLYAELMERLVANGAARAIGHVDGSFVTKRIRGHDYVYFQQAVPGARQRQVYLGPRSPAIDGLVARFREQRSDVEAEAIALRQLGGAFREAGGTLTDTASGRVLRAFAEGGVFAAGGVLVGTHAFLVLGNLLGRRWQGVSIRTLDVDIARGTRPDLEIALDTKGADVPSILDSLEMGFVPMPELDRKHPHASFIVRGKGLRVDFVAPGRTADPPALVTRFGTAAKPLDGIGYLVARPERGAVVNGAPVLVNVPRPGRFALHKLFLSRSRPLVKQDKARKDLAQAAALVEALAEDRPEDLLEAWRDLLDHHPRDASLARSAAKQLPKDWAAARDALAFLM